MRATVSELFEARSVAVIGASDDRDKIAGKPLALLREGGFHGTVYAVNPRRELVQGERAYPSVQAIGEPIDLAILAVPAHLCIDAVRDCVAAGVKGAVVFAGGMAETGEEGRRMQEQMQAIAREAGLRLLGPNCMGMMNFSTGLLATFSNTTEGLKPTPSQPGIALVSQSGALGNYALTRALDVGIPMVRWIATGNESDIEFAEAIDAMLDEPDVRGVLCYLEGARNGAQLKAVLERARRQRCPVALIKVGKTATGAAAIRSHTDALAGDDKLYDALFEKTGTIRVSTIDQLLELGRVFAAGMRIDPEKAARPGGPGLLLTSVSGGVGVIMAEAADAEGLRLVELSDSTCATLKEHLPFMTPNNPLDVTGQVTQNFDLLRMAIATSLKDTRADCVVSFIGRMARRPEIVEQYLAVLDRLKAEHPKTVILTVGMIDASVDRLFRSRGYLALGDPSRAVWVAATLARIAAAQGATRATATVDVARFRRPPPVGGLDEKAGYDLLASLGIGAPEHRVVGSAAEAADAARAMGGALAMKILYADIAHKSDVGGVKLGIRSADEAVVAHDAIMASVRAAMPGARLDGVLVSRMESHFTELVIGARVDPQMGASIMVGLGGIFVELLEDVSVRLAPVTIEEAAGMLTDLKASGILTGARGRAPADLTAAAEAIAALSQFAAANENWLSSIEINPFALRRAGQGGLALDCSVALKEGDDT